MFKDGTTSVKYFFTELFFTVADIDITSHVDDNFSHMAGNTDDVLINNALFD